MRYSSYLKAGLLGAVLTTASVVGVQAQTSLKLGYSLAPTSHYGVGATAMAEELERLSDGAFTIEQFPANALGGEREMVEGAQIGTVDLVITSTGPVGNFVPDTLITDIPFLFRDYEHAHAGARWTDRPESAGAVPRSRSRRARLGRKRLPQT